MNFLHINASDIRWGASIAGYRFHKALLDKGFGSHILCGLKESLGDDTTPIVPGHYGYIPNALAGKFFNFLGLQSFGYPSSLFLKSSEWVNGWADVVILRNLHWWYISVGILPWIAQRAPLIWRLPDMWAFTGHCIYSYDCQKWKTGCGECPSLSSYPHLFFDTTHFLWKRKKKIYEKLRDNLVFVSPSKWLLEKLKESPLMEGFQYEHIPTAVDLNIFRPDLKESARAILNIDNKEKVIMCSSFKLSDKRKSIDDCLGIADSLREKLNLPLTVMIVGHRGENINLPRGLKAVKIGFISDDRFLCACYNACDVYLSLSKADNFPNTLVEACACGVPVVTLDSGGCPEIVKNGSNGYVVKNNSEAVESLKAILENDSKKKEFSLNARDIARKNFSMEGQVDRYVFLAKELAERYRVRHEV